MGAKDRQLGGERIWTIQVGEKTFRNLVSCGSPEIMILDDGDSSKVGGKDSKNTTADST